MRKITILRMSSSYLCAILVASLLLIMVTSASYPMFHYNLQRTGNVSGEAPVTNQIYWSTDLGGPVGSSPIVSDGKVFVSNWFAEWSGGVNGLYCLDEATGAILWRNPLSGSGGASTGAIAGDKLFVGSYSGFLYCLNATSGETLWNEWIEHSPAWWGVASSPLVYDDTIFVTTFSNNASNNGTLHVFDFDGNYLWNLSTGDTFYYTSPAIADGKVFFAGNLTNHSLFCVNISSRTIEWRFNTSTQIKSTPAIWNDTVFFASKDRMCAVDAQTGDEVWTNPFSCVMSSPAVSNGKVYIGSSSNKLSCYDASSGSELWNTTVNGPIYSSPVVANNTVYFGTNTADGTIYALNATDGTLRWSYASSNFIMSSPAVVDGIVFIGADDGSVYAFGETLTITTTIRIEGKNETIWSGEVTLSNSTIVDTDNVSHYLDKPTALGAVDAASKLGNFSYEVKNQTERLFLESLRGEANNTETGDRWLYRVDYYSPTVGAADFVLGMSEPPTAPHQEVLWYYGAWTDDPLNITLEKTCVAASESFNATVRYYNDTTSGWELLDNATVYVGTLNFTTGSDGNATLSLSSAGTYIVYAEKEGFIRSSKQDVSVFVPRINVRIEGKNETIWNGDVTFSNSTIVDMDNVSHYLDKPTALGAVDAASKLGNFSYEVKNDQTYGLFLNSIAGEAYDTMTWDGWMYRVDYHSLMVGAADFVINVTEPPSAPHAEVLWYYGSWTAAPLRLTLDKTKVNVNEHFISTVESFNDTSGLWDPIENATVYVDSSNYTTDLNGSVVIALSNSGSYTFYAEKEGYVRSGKKSVTVTSEDDGGGGGDDTSYWWQGSVTLPSGTFTKSTFDTNKDYTINWQTALGALQKASEVGGFPYTLEETTWGPMVYAIADKEKYDEGETSGWMYQVNDETPMVGAHDYSVGVDDEIVWYFSKSMETTPSTSSRVLKITIQGSDGDSGSGDSSSTPTPTPAPNQLVEEVKEIELIEAGANASVTFDKMDVTQITLNANNTIRNASIMIQPLGKTAFIVNVSGIPYCYFNITTTNLTDADLAQATVEFKVNKSWLNASNIDEATITLSRYSDNHWNALPTVKIGEDNTSLYFKAVTPGFSSFAISGESPVSPLISAPSATTLPAPAATTKDTSSSALTPTPASTPPALIPRIKEIIITMVSIAVLLIVLVAYFTRRRDRE